MSSLQNAVDVAKSGGAHTRVSTVIALENRAQTAGADAVLRHLFDTMGDAVFLVALDSDGVPTRFAEVNRPACEMLGYGRDELLRLSPWDVMASGANTISAQIRGLAHDVNASGQAFFLTALIDKNGWQVPVEINTRRMTLDGQAYNLSSARDVSRREDIQNRLSMANNQLYDIIDSLPDATVVLDQERRIISWNQAMEALTGVRKKDVLGQVDAYGLAIYGAPEPCLIDLIRRDPSALPERYRNVRQKGRITSAEVFVPGLKGGLGAHLVVTATILRDENGLEVGAVETLHDITEQREMEERLAYMGTHDSLTGLQSRAAFEAALKSFDGSLSEKGVIICDVDGLKLVNDSLGHLAGDLMLKRAADILRSCFRDTDVVARIGGDELAVLLPRCAPDTITAARQRIVQSVACHNKDHPGLPLSISVGSASGTTTSGADLYRMADDAMYREKLHHGNSARGAIVGALMKTLEARDIVTEQHSARTEVLSAALASAIGLPERDIAELRLLARFHDIGKISIADSILLKPSSLAPEETVEMRRHCQVGYRIALASPDLLPIADWILHHHERWDGTGYPAGLKGEEIPVECRVVAIVDAYDAMTNDRPYRKAMTTKAALAELERCSGTQFDPLLTEQFISMQRMCWPNGPNSG